MKLFGILKGLEYLERELNEIEFSTTKEDIRKHGSNALILMEKLTKELIYVYGYLFFEDDYKNKLAGSVNLNKHLMFGSAIHGLRDMNKLLLNKENKHKFNNYFDRDYIVFREDDNIFSDFIKCTKLRGSILHDEIKNVENIYQYKNEVVNAIELSCKCLRYLKDNNLFPTIIECQNITLEKGYNVLNFKDEIESNIPIKYEGNDIELIREKNWYIFRKCRKILLIPVENHINVFQNEEKSENYFVIKDKQEKSYGYLVSNNMSKYYINKHKIFIGRYINSDIRFNNMSISRNHCMIKIIKDNIFIVDLGSKFGTIVNGQAIEAYEEFLLRDKDKIIIGKGIDKVEIYYYI